MLSNFCYLNIFAIQFNIQTNYFIHLIHLLLKLCLFKYSNYANFNIQIYIIYVIYKIYIISMYSPLSQLLWFSFGDQPLIPKELSFFYSILYNNKIEPKISLSLCLLLYLRIRRIKSIAGSFFFFVQRLDYINNKVTMLQRTTALHLLYTTIYTKKERLQISYRRKSPKDSNSPSSVTLLLPKTFGRHIQT